MSKCFLLLGASLALVMLTGAAVLGFGYQAVRIGGYETEADAINNGGLIVGQDAYAGKACYWQGQVESYLTAGHARAVNSSGLIVGQDITSNACFWQNGVPTKLGSLYGQNAFSQPNGVNDSGQIAGASWTSDGKTSHACSWYGGSITDLGTLTGYSSSGAGAINASGQIAGESWTSSTGIYHACIWDHGSVQDLGAWGGENGSCYAFGINDHGAVVGQSEARPYSQSGSHAWLWQDGNLTDLGLGGAYAINNNGQIVGWSYDLLTHHHYACLWQNGSKTILPAWSPGADSIAYGINSSGQIVGLSVQDSEAILWQPIPEPSSILALLCGIGGLGGMVVRRKR